MSHRWCGLSVSSACSVIDPLAQGFTIPAPSAPLRAALRKEREGRGAPRVCDASEIRSLGHPPEIMGSSFRPPQLEPRW